MPIADELKAVSEELQKTLKVFQDNNDALLKKHDGVLSDQGEKLALAITDLEGTKQTIQDIQKMLTRPELDEGKAAEAEQAKAAREYTESFVKYLRSGGGNRNAAMDTAEVKALEKKALSVGSDPDGGYVVTPAMSAQIRTRVFETSPMRAYANVETIGTDRLEFIYDDDEATCGWVSETGSRPTTNSPQLAMGEIPVHELYAFPKATQKLLDDAYLDVESWLAKKVGDAFLRKENTAFYSGDGVGKPRGILTYTAGSASYVRGQIEQVVSGAAADITADGFISLQNALKEDYQPGAIWQMRRTTFGAAIKLKNGIGQYLYGPGLNGEMREGALLLGKTVRFAADVPAVGANALAVAYGDFGRGYTIVDRIGVRTLRDPFTNKPFVGFYSTKRVGGAVTNFEAIKLGKCST